jgi:hypothetical protein
VRSLAENAVFGVPMGNIPEAKVVQYDANMCHYDAKFVHYDANIVQGDAIFVPKRNRGFRGFQDKDLPQSSKRVKKINTEAAEDAESGMLEQGLDPGSGAGMTGPFCGRSRLYLIVNIQFCVL